MEYRRTRARAALALVAATFASLLVVSTAGAATVSGPIAGSPTAVATTAFDPSQVGYSLSEFFMSGTARSYLPTAPVGADGKWSVAPSASADYKTRVITYRPSDPKTFNGTVYVEWLNVTTSQDFAADWLYAHTEVVHQGAAYVFVSAQQIGVNTAKALNPGRYGSLTHPGDSFSYDIYTQAGKAIRSDAATLLGGLRPKRLVAVGESQSAGRLTTYFNAMQPLADIYDGFLLHSRIGGGAAPLSQAPQADVPAAGGTRLRTDQVPALVFQTETDALSNPANTILQPDSALYRQWDVTGAAHADSYLVSGSQTAFFDVGDSAATATAVFDSMLHPSAQTILGTCAAPIDSGPAHYVLESAFDSVNRWVTTGRSPASAPRFRYTSLSPVAFAYDSNGNVRDGIRTPFVDVPIAKLSGAPVPGSPGLCTLFGSTTPFDQARLHDLYSSHAEYVLRFGVATLSSVLHGWIEPRQVSALVRAAKAAPIP